jgi:hypothetical protein
VGEPEYQVLEISSYGQHGRLIHVVAKAGDLRDGFYFPLPAADSEVTVSPGPTPPERNEPILLGAPTWDDRVGTLVLAPSFPAGGIDGDHIIFKWNDDGTDYAVSMHTWRPMAETEATLRSLVESIGRPSTSVP